MPEKLISAYMTYIAWVFLLVIYGAVSIGFLSYQDRVFAVTEAKVTVDKIVYVISILDYGCPEVNTTITIDTNIRIVISDHNIVAHFGNEQIFTATISKSVERFVINETAEYSFRLESSGSVRVVKVD